MLMICFCLISLKILLLATFPTCHTVEEIYDAMSLLKPAKRVGLRFLKKKGKSFGPQTLLE